MHTHLQCCLIQRIVKSGQTPSLDGPTSGVLGSSVHLICTLPGSSATVGLLPFNRAGAAGTQCTVNIAECSQFSAVNGSSFSCGCVSGQNQGFYLNISSLRKQDDDTWRCTYNGVNSNNVSLSVYYAPEIFSSFPNNKDVTENSSPNIDCSSDLTAGNPPDTSYTWTGPGGYIKSGSVLDIIVSRSQGGPYTCTARNSAGLSDTVTVNINVQYAPEIYSFFPNNKDVTENSSPNIDCSSGLTAGNPSDTNYTWTGPGGYSKSGSVLDRRFSRSQGGSYTCTARNTAGLSDSAQVNINVQYAPEISSSFPNNKDVTENSSPNIDCSSNLTAGNPSDTSYTWTGPGGYNKSGSVLDRRVSRSQGGSYTCTARNSAGLSDSAQVNINVQYTPEISASFPNNKDVTENSSPNIDCSSRLTDGKPSDTSYTWTGPGGYSKSGSVLDRRVSRSQGGSYNCTARNSAGLSDSAQVNINVQYGASISEFSLNSAAGPVTVSEGDTVNLKCQVDSNPPATIRLLNGSQELKRGDNSLPVTSTWQTTCRQRGNYSCTANNSVGPTAVRDLNLAVECSPRPDETYPVKYQSASRLVSSVTLWMSVLSYPVPTFTWSRSYSSSQDLSGSLRVLSDISVNISLTLTSLKREDFGLYNLTFSNGVGEDTVTSFEVVPQGPPDMPTDVQVREISLNSALVSWTRGFNAGDTQHFTVSYSMDNTTWVNTSRIEEKESSENYDIILSNLNPSTLYIVRVIAGNKYGDSTYTEAVILKIKAEPKDVAITDNLETGLGIGLGITIPVIVVLVVAVVVLYKRRNTSGKSPSTNRALQQTAVEDVGSAAPVDTSTYAGLDNTTRTQEYAELKLYENTKNGTSANNTLRNQSADSQPKPYEDVALHTYANTKPQSGDPAYANMNFS